MVKRIAITGAFSYSGNYIARELFTQGHELITLTGNPNRLNQFNGKVPAYPFNFSDPESLIETLRGIDTLINTYWVRFNRGEITYLRTVSNIRTLFRAALKAGVKRVVHISITNPDSQSKLDYFWGKAILEEDLIASGMSYAILRPTVIFGKEDILINNIAWFLRYFPVFLYPGDGSYRLQPIYVEDLARLAAFQAVGNEDVIINAIGPETFTFKELLEMLSKQLDRSPLLIPSPPSIPLFISKLVGLLLQDNILTYDELVGLMGNLLFVSSPPTGQTRLSDWVPEHIDSLGKRYSHEINRHYI